MSAIDWTVIVVYMGGMVGLSVFLGRGQENQEDYYVGGRDLPWWAVGISTMATQTSAISFISVPAFVSMREGGGLTWLQYELAVPLAMIFIMVFLIPFFRKLELISVYEYLELRFGPGTRGLLAGVFLLSRGLGTGVGVYASAIVLSVCLQMDLWLVIVVIGVVTLIYDTIGGMKAVVYSDVIQMVVLVLGIALCVFYGLREVGGWQAAISSFDPARFTALDFRTGLGDGAAFPFWSFLFGGFFLYASYYGADQSQVQRELSAPTLAHTKYSLVFNGFARLPLTLAYIVLGLGVGAVFVRNPEAAGLIPENKLDYMVPTFVLHYLPQGVRALIFSAILAAAMSSLDSSLNSLSASTMRDFVERYLSMARDPSSHLKLSKLTTVGWGVLIIFFAFLLGGEDTVVERINKVGSAFYGPILAAFLTGVTLRRVSGWNMVVGIIAGVALNLTLWLSHAQIFWMWWNLFGCVTSMAVAMLMSLVGSPPAGERLKGLILWDSPLWAKEREWLPTYGLLALYFACMMIFCGMLPGLLGGS